MKKIQGFEKKGICIILCVCMLSLAIGSFCDYQLSSAIFDKNNIICIFFAAYGQLPVSLGMSILATLLIYVCKKTWCLRSIGAVIAGILLHAMALFMGILEPSLYFVDVPIVFIAILAIALLLIVNFITLRFVKDISKDELVRFIKFGLFVIFAQLILINIIKIPWGRPRMRMIVETPDAYFQPWWIIGSSMKQNLMALGVASEEFKSFPSGHTASATCILIFSVLPMLKLQSHRYVNITFYVGLLFAVIVAFSRIVMGAHFLSDVTVGFFVSFVLVTLAYNYFYKRKLGGKYE